MKKVEHIGIAVRNLRAAEAVYEKLLGIAAYKEEEVDSEGVRTLFFKAGPNKIELLEATGEDSPIARFIEKRGEGVHHIAFAVDDIGAEMERLRKEGFTVLQDKPIAGADNKWVAFVHPKDAAGVLIELCEDRG